MSFRVLEKYIELCNVFCIDPTWNGLKLFNNVFK